MSHQILQSRMMTNDMEPYTTNAKVALKRTTRSVCFICSSDLENSIGKLRIFSVDGNKAFKKSCTDLENCFHYKQCNVKDNTCFECSRSLNECHSKPIESKIIYGKLCMIVQKCGDPNECSFASLARNAFCL